MSTRSQTPPESSTIATFTRRVDEINRGRSWIRRLLRRAFPGRAEFEQVLLAALSGLAQEAARDREAVEAVRRQTALLELLADGLRNAFRACETAIREQAEASAEQHDDALRRVLRLDQIAGEARNDLAALGRAQAAVSGRLAGIEQRQAAAAESIRAEAGALRARLAETDGEFRELLAGTNRALAELQAETARQQRSVGENLESFRQQAAVLAARVAEAGAALPSTELVAQLSQLDRRLQALESIAVAALPGSPGMGSFASRMIAVEAAMPALQRALSVRTSAAPRGGARRKR
jgi:hypothetical protein